MTCNDCGLTHLTGLDAIRCDERLGLCTPSMSEVERLALLIDGEKE